MCRRLVAITSAIVSPLRKERLHWAATWCQDQLRCPLFWGGLGLTARVVGLLQVAIAVPWPCGELLHCGFYFLLFFSLHPANVSKAFC